MRKLVVLSFVSLDGVMQAPGGPEEDPSDGFAYGGWTVPFWDEWAGQVMEEQMGHPMDLLLGRKTYDIFASYWPSRESPFNAATKYVASRTLTGDRWPRTVILRDDVPARVRQLKQEDGPELQVHGSGNLIQTLLKHDLVDEIWLKIFPVTLGPGKRLFGEGTIPASFTLVDSRTSPRGVIVATLVRSGPVETGSF